MANNPKNITKLGKTAPAPLTKEEQAQQIARFFAQKREALFQGILFNAIRIWPSEKYLDLKVAVDASLEAADYALEKLYPMPKEEAPKEGETK